MQWVLYFSITFFSLAAVAASPSSESLEELMQQWLRLESQNGHLQNQWHERSQLLDQKLATFSKEQQVLEEVLSKTTQERGEVDARRQEMLELQTGLEQEQQRVSDALETAVIAVNRMLPRLPPPLHDAWQEKILVLNQDGVSNSEQLERVLGMFKLVEDFNSRVVLHRGTVAVHRNSGDDIRVLVNQVYLGAGRGWYVSDDGQYFGYGSATSTGWQWQHWVENDSVNGLGLTGKQISAVVAVLENPTRARYLQLPLALEDQQ